MKLRELLILTLSVLYLAPVHADKLAHLRSSRQIITVDQISAPYYTIQVVALKEPPQNAEFFAELKEVYEYNCNDGFVRYTVGRYASFGDALDDLNILKANGYQDAFILNTRKISIVNTSGSSFTVDKNQAPVAGRRYTIQIAAFRFPVYVSEFKEFDSVVEYYMADKIYRYCVGDYDGSEVMAELLKVRERGYQNAFLVPIEKYAPYRIE